MSGPRHLLSHRWQARRPCPHPCRKRLSAHQYPPQASRHIDTLTYNRVVECGFSTLSEFQKKVLAGVICKQAEFEYENREIFDMILQSYSINGVSMQFGDSWNVELQKGIPIRRDVYAELCQTGLCSRLMG